MIRQTAGELSHKALSDTTKYDSREVGHAMTADVIPKGWGEANPQNHWEIDVGKSVFPQYEDNPRGAFLAGNGRIRPQPYVKINECDH